MKRYILAALLTMSVLTTKAQIIINEVQADAGNYENSGGDWIELKNIGTSMEDLSCWTLTNGGSVIIAIPSGVMLDPGQYLLIGNKSKMMCPTCDYKNLFNAFTLNPDGFGPGSGSYLNTIWLNTDVAVNGGCGCLVGSGNFNNGTGSGDRVVLFNSASQVVDAMMFANGNYYGSGPINVNIPASATCGVNLAVLPASSNPVFAGRSICNDLTGCNSSFARLPDGNNGGNVTYDQTGNLACTSCLAPCTASATNTASTDNPTPGLSNDQGINSWSATLNGNAFTTSSASMTVCGATPVNFTYTINHFTNVSLTPTQASGNLGSYVQTNGGTPTAFSSTSFNTGTGVTTLSANIIPGNGTNVYTLVWGDGNSNCTTCPGSASGSVPGNPASTESECYVTRQVSITREDALGGTPTASCSIPGTITVSGATGTNILYTLQKQSVAAGPFVTISGPSPNSIIGGIFDDDADPALPNYQVLVSSNNTVCSNPTPIVVPVPNGCLGNPACPVFVSSGPGSPTFTPAPGSQVCANGNVNFTVNINGVCTTGQVEVKYSHDPAFDPYVSGTSLGIAGTTVGTTPPTTTATGRVFINEFVVRPAQGTCTGTPDGINPNSGEWVELYNAGPGNVDISGWIIADGDWTGTIPAGTMLNAGLHYLIGGGGTFCSSGVTPDLNLETCNCATVVTGSDMMNLTNGGEQLALFDCSGTFIDGVLWGSGQAIPDVTDNNAPATGCGNYIPAKSVNLPAAASFASSGTIASPNSGKYRSSTNTWVTTASTAITPKAANPGGNWNGASVNFGTQCPPPPVTSTLNVTLPDTCAQNNSTSITLKAIYKPDPISPCLKSDVTAAATFTIPPCETLTLSGNGEYCQPASAPVTITSTGSLTGNHSINLSNGSNTASINPASGAGPFNANLFSSGNWTISSITPPAGSCPPKKTGSANIVIHPIPGIIGAPGTASFCYTYGFDLSSLQPSFTSVPPTSNYVWYDQPTGGAPISPIVNPAATTTYYVAATTGAPSNCEATFRYPVTLNVDPLPAVPTVSSNGMSATFSPLSPDCIPTPCPTGLEYSIDGSSWSAGPTFTAADPGWSGFGSPTNSKVFIRNAASPACFIYVTYFVPAAPLPTRLFDFSGKKNNTGGTDLQWKTADEKNMAKYSIERSHDKGGFYAIGEVKANNLEQVSSLYSFTDVNPLPGSNYYRLKMTDLDGQFVYSHVIEVQHEHAANGIAAVFPIPSSGQLNVELQSAEESKATLQLFDASGRVILTLNRELSAGVSRHQLDLSAIEAGFYTLQVSIGVEKFTRSFVRE